MRNHFIKLFIIACAIAMLISPAISKAATVEELQAQVQALLQQIKLIQEQSTQQQSGGQSGCYVFNANLKIGDQNNGVTNLIRALVKEGLLDSNEMLQDGRTILNFDETVAAAVSAFQEKYRDEILTPNGLKYATGYVGKATRVKLNQLYGCGGGNVNSGELYIEPASPKLKIGDKLQLRAMYQPPMPKCPEGAYCAQVLPAPYPVAASWYTSDYGVINLLSKDSGEGITIGGVAAGTAELKAMYTFPLLMCSSPACPRGNVIATTRVNVAKAENPSITVLSPNGGEVWQLGNTHTILWTPYDPKRGINPALSAVNAYLEKLVNGDFVTVGKVLPGGKASIHWDGDLDTYGNYPVPGEYYIRITNSQTGAIDRSDKPFTLVARNTIKADIKINNSDGPVTLSPGSTYNVSWSSTNADSCEIYYPQDATGVQAIYSTGSPAGDKSFSFPGDPYGAYVTLLCKSSKIEGTASDVVLLKSLQPLSLITIISPNGGENINFSSSYTINWKHTSDIARFSIALYKNDAFLSWITTNLPVATKEGGTFVWTPSNTISSANIGSNVFKIYMIGYKASGGTVEDKSDAPFSITAAGIVTTGPSLTVSVDPSTHASRDIPQGTSNTTVATFRLNNTSSEDVDVSAMYVGGVGNTSDISAVFVNDGATKLGFAILSLNTNSNIFNHVQLNFPEALRIPAYSSKTLFFSVDVPPSAPIGDKFSLGIQDGTITGVKSGIKNSFNFVSYNGPTVGNTMTVVSPLAAPSITIISPNGGETFSVGSTLTVRWSNTNYRNSVVNIYLYRSNTASAENDYNYVAQIGSLRQPNDGTETWTIPSTVSTGNNYFVRINLDVQDPQTGMDTFDDSDALFSITSAAAPTPSFTVVSPTTSWLAGSTQTINWSSANYPSTSMVKIQLYQNQDGTPPTLTPYLSLVAQNNGSASWTIPSSVVQAPNYRISVTCDEAGLQSYGSCSGGMSQSFGIMAAVPTQTPTITPSKTTAAPGETISVSWTNNGTTTAKDWIGVAPSKGQWSSTYNWFYTDGLASGTKTIAMPASAGSYDLVYYPNNGFTGLTRIGPINVGLVSAGLGAQAPSSQYSASMLDSIKANLDRIQMEINNLRR